MTSSLSIRLSGASSPAFSTYAYVIGQVGGEQMVLQNGAWASVAAFLGTGSSALQPGTSLQMHLPAQDVVGGRIYISQQPLHFSTAGPPMGGQTVLRYPNAVSTADADYDTSYSFVEFAWSQASGSWINLSYVDFVGLPVGIKLEQQTLSTSEEVCGLSAASLNALCEGLKQQTSIDGQPWAELCVRTSDQQSWHRAISPWQYRTMYPDAFNGFWDAYVDEVWARYGQEALLVDTETSAGRVACRVVNDQLQCEGDNRSYDRPTAADIFSCASGTFALLPQDNLIHQAVVPRLCAAFTRSTLHLPDGNSQPLEDASRFYLPPITHHWSRLIHNLEADGRGYAFPYDDVGGAASGLLHAPGPAVLTIMAESC